MKRLLPLILLLCASPAFGQSLATVTGNAKNLMGASAGSGTIYFSISNYAGPMYVTGTAIIVPATVKGTVLSDGSFSVQLWGNDVIDPANTLYDVRIVVSGGSFEGLYSITGASFNLNAAIPTGTPPAPVFVGIALPLSLTQGGFTNSLAGSVTAARTWTLQDASDTFVFRNTADTLTSKTFDVSANTLKNSTNTAGHYLRNNGSQYADSAIQAGDLPSGTGCGANQFANGLSAGLIFACAQPSFSNLSGIASTSQIGTGTPGSGKYVDGGTGAWTALPGAEAVIEHEPIGTAGQTLTSGIAPCSTGVASCTIVVLANSHTLIRFMYFLQTSPAGCTTAPGIGVRDITAGSNVYNTTIANGASLGTVDSGALNLTMTAGHTYGVGPTQQSSGCSTNANIIGVVAVYQ